MKHSKLLERALRLQRRIEAKGLNVVVRVSRQVTKFSNYSYLVLHNIKTDKIDVNLEECSDNEIIQHAEELTKPKYTTLKNLCINSLNESVYIKKDNEYIELDIVSITKDGLSLSDGNVYSQNEIYIKE